MRRTLMAALMTCWCGLSALAFPPFKDEEQDVDAIIVLAVDVSRTIGEQEWDLQRKGYARAFESPEVADAISGGRLGRIAVTFVQWADYDKQSQYGGWVVLTPETMRSYARIFANMKRMSGEFTSIVGALKFCTTLIEQAPFHARRRIINVSGDGKNNQTWSNRGGDDVSEGRNPALEQGITINGMPIASADPKDSAAVAAYYKESVIGGPDAFSIAVETSNDFDAFTRAVITKLKIEIVASR